MSEDIIQFNLLELLPQRPPFIMIDKLIFYSQSLVKTEFIVRSGNIFCHDGIFEEAGLVENIAQTCASKIGYEEKAGIKGNGEIKIGFIGMIKSMKIFRAPLIDEKLVTTVAIKEDVFSITQVEAKVEIDGEVIAKCEMKIYLTDKTPGNAK
jgi:3-hydroxymyristoyl/3-hydroxydecanoyl-(acyl carrier protein) dehydratase